MSIILDACQLPRARWSPTPDRTTGSASKVALHCPSNVSALNGALLLNGPFAFSVASNGFTIQFAWKSPRLFHRCHRTDRVAPATRSVTYCRLRSRNADFEQSIFASKRRHEADASQHPLHDKM